MLKPMKLVVHLIVLGIVLGLMLAVPQMVHQRQVVLKSCEVLMGKAQKNGCILQQSYDEFQEDLKRVGMLDQVQDIVVHPGLDRQVQKRMPMMIEMNLVYEVEIPFVGKKTVTGDKLSLQAFSHKYFK